MDTINLSIEQIILDGLSIKPERMGQIRTTIETELQRLLEREGIIENPKSSEFNHLNTSPIYLNEPKNEMHLASSIAQRIAQVLKKLG